MQLYSQITDVFWNGDNKSFGFLRQIVANFNMVIVKFDP